MEHSKNRPLVYTFGCKVNQVESREISESFKGHDASLVVVVNTCTVTSKADAKCRAFINRMVKKYPDKKIVITGCYVQRAIQELKTLYPDLVFVKNEDKKVIPQVLKLEKMDKVEQIKPGKTRAFLKIQDGCDAFCAYCIVPYVRSKKWSKPIEEIKEEMRDIDSQGFKEIVLTGVNLGFYKFIDNNNKEWKFIDIVKWIVDAKDFENLKRIRISSIDPQDITDESIKMFKENIYIDEHTGGRLCPHLHIPIQSADDSVLRAMGRKYDVLFLEKLIRKLRKNIKGIRITIDLIIGFPGETDEAFENTLKFLKDMEIDGMHVFPFSARVGTKAYNMKNKVPSHKIKMRKKILKELDAELRLNSLKKYVGALQEILVESKKKNGYLEGLTPNYIRVQVPYEKGIKNSLFKLRIKKEELRI